MMTLSLGRRRLLSATGPACLAACAKPRVQTSQSYLGEALPRPERVLVAYFAATPDQVRLDQGVGARVQRAVGDQPANADQLLVEQHIQTALAEALVQRLRAYGLPAELGGLPDRPGPVLLVQGQIVAIDQGNRTRRVLVGLGAGKSTVSADAQLYFHFASGAVPPRFLTAFEGEADSGRMPGAAMTMGAGAAAQTIGTSAAVTVGTHAAGESRRDTSSSEARNLATALALRIGQFAASQGWIAASALQ